MKACRSHLATSLMLERGGHCASWVVSVCEIWKWKPVQDGDSRNIDQSRHTQAVLQRHCAFAFLYCPICHWVQSLSLVFQLFSLPLTVPISRLTYLFRTNLCQLEIYPSTPNTTNPKHPAFNQQPLHSPSPFPKAFELLGHFQQVRVVGLKEKKILQVSRRRAF